MDQATESPVQYNQLLPTPAIICISIGAYVVVIVLVLVIRQVLLARGFCQDCGCCGKEGEARCCDCWLSMAEACNCCRNPNISSCLDAICPARQHLDCADIIMCQCCQQSDSGCCQGNEPLCDCGNCDCTCACQPPACETINCCCCEINMKSPMAGNDERY